MATFGGHCTQQAIPDIAYHVSISGKVAVHEDALRRVSPGLRRGHVVHAASAHQHRLLVRPAYKQGQRPWQRHPARAVFQAGPEGHQDTVPDGVIAELEAHPAATALPIQVMKHLSDVSIISRAKGPATLDERWALARMRWWPFRGALGLSSGCLLLRPTAVTRQGMEMARQEGESGCVCLTRQVWHVVPWAGISEASQGDFVVIAVQSHTFPQCHPKVRHGVIWVQRLAGITGQGEDHGAVKSQCGTRHLETLWRRGAPAPPSSPGAAAPARDGTATDLDYVPFPGVETGRVTGPLNQVLCYLSLPVRVQDVFPSK